MPVSILMVVDLPAPLGPMKPSSSPASIWNVSLRTASTELYSGLNSARTEPLMPAALRLVWNVFCKLATSMDDMDDILHRFVCQSSIDFNSSVSGIIISPYFSFNFSQDL